MHIVNLPSFSTNYLQMDELACFAPGMLALGSFGYGPEDSQKFLSLAEEVLWWKFSINVYISGSLMSCLNS